MYIGIGRLEKNYGPHARVSPPLCHPVHTQHTDLCKRGASSCLVILADLIDQWSFIQYYFFSHLWFLEWLCPLPPQGLHNVSFLTFCTTITSLGRIQFHKQWNELKVFKNVLQVLVHHFSRFTPKKIIYDSCISRISSIFFQILEIGPVSSDEKRSWTEEESR